MNPRQTCPRIVIGESDDELRTSLCRLLSALSVEVSAACNGAELILMMTDEQPITVLIANVDLPWINGLHVALSARHSGLDMPIIFLATRPQEPVRQQINAVEDSELLTLPVRPEELLSLVRAHLFPPGTDVRALPETETPRTRLSHRGLSGSAT